MFAEAESNRLFAMHYSPEYDAATILRAHQEWAERCERPLAGAIQPHRNDRSASAGCGWGTFRGILAIIRSGGFCSRCLPATHRQQVEVFCYSNLTRNDPIAKRLRSGANEWRDIEPLGDDEAAELIRKDKIDILVDLALHSARNRLAVRESRAGAGDVAGICVDDGAVGDGLSAERSVDRFSGSERYYTEERWLPHCFWCYQRFGIRRGHWAAAGTDLQSHHI